MPCTYSVNIWWDQNESFDSHESLGFLQRKKDHHSLHCKRCFIDKETETQRGEVTSLILPGTIMEKPNMGCRRKDHWYRACPAAARYLKSVKFYRQVLSPSIILKTSRKMQGMRGHVEPRGDAREVPLQVERRRGRSLILERGEEGGPWPALRALLRGWNCTQKAKGTCLWALKRRHDHVQSVYGPCTVRGPVTSDHCDKCVAGAFWSDAMQRDCRCDQRTVYRGESQRSRSASRGGARSPESESAASGRQVLNARGDRGKLRQESEIPHWDHWAALLLTGVERAVHA